MKRLVALVEGEGDQAAVPNLIARLLAEHPAECQGSLFVDDRGTRKIGNVHEISGRLQSEWLRHLRNAANRANLGAVLLLLDGDSDTFEDQPFCAAVAARTLAERARQAGAGVGFSVGVVFLRQEYESLLIASYPTLPERREGVARPTNPEESPRGAKKWLAENRDGGYKETRDQAILTQAAGLDLIRAANLRSFRRLEHALLELAVAAQTGQHISSPAAPPQPPAEPT
jgi:hypothetical protein